MGFYEDDRIRSKNAKFNVITDNKEQYTVVADANTLNKMIDVLGANGLNVDIRDRVILVNKDS